MIKIYQIDLVVSSMAAALQMFRREEVARTATSPSIAPVRRSNEEQSHKWKSHMSNNIYLSTWWRDQVGQKHLHCNFAALTKNGRWGTIIGFDKPLLLHLSRIHTKGPLIIHFHLTIWKANKRQWFWSFLKYNQPIKSFNILSYINFAKLRRCVSWVNFKLRKC